MPWDPISGHSYSTLSRGPVVRHVPAAILTPLIRQLSDINLPIGSAERILEGVPEDVKALIPLNMRKPVPVRGNIYEQVACRRLTYRSAETLMWNYRITPTEYARNWLRHALYIELGYTAEAISAAEKDGTL